MNVIEYSYITQPVVLPFFGRDYVRELHPGDYVMLHYVLDSRFPSSYSYALCKYVCLDTARVLCVQSQGEPGVTIERIRNTSRMIIYSVTRSHSGDYLCSASNRVGNDTRTMTLVVECTYIAAAL